MASKVRIKGHEKFPLREGWLTKGLFAVHEKGTKFFNENNARDQLLTYASALRDGQKNTK